VDLCDAAQGTALGRGYEYTLACTVLGVAPVEAMGHDSEIRAGTRFEFGKNWGQFLRALSDDRIETAERSLQTLLSMKDLNGKSFLDVGSGSGLFSLAARRLGATVHSFDFDPDSVACTLELKRRYFPGDTRWQIEEGSVLNESYLRAMGQFDVVYSWGVLHHTGAMWKALESVASLIKNGGKLVIAIYNDQGGGSRRWLLVKRAYNRLPSWTRGLVLWPAFVRLWGKTMLRDLLLGNPLQSWNRYGRERGMSPWRDVVDWVGGYPFEVATPEAIFEYFSSRGFRLTKLKTCGGGHGCNEFVFERNSFAPSLPSSVVSLE
jgi:SAM-dependent methyltransferase